MGAVVVEVLAEAVEAGLLLARARGRGLGSLGLQGPMHALVPPVLLGLARLDPLQRDAGLDPAERQARQPARAGSGERRPVVRTDGQRQAVALEELLDQRTDRVGPGRDDDAGQQETAVGVADGQGVAAFAVAGAEPALEVDAPDIVGRADGAERPAGRGRATAPAARAHQPFRLQQIAHRAGRRPHHVGARASAPRAACAAPNGDAAGAERQSPRPAPAPWTDRDDAAHSAARRWSACAGRTASSAPRATIAGIACWRAGGSINATVARSRHRPWQARSSTRPSCR